MEKKELIKMLEKYTPQYEEEIKYKAQMLQFLEENDIFLGKQNTKGHITGSAWIVSKDREKVLFTHHKKLNMWVQLGGHTEEGEAVLQSALREGLEESGLKHLKVLSQDIFDLDVHLFPARQEQPAHYHYDIRFLLEADEEEKLVVSAESKDVKWVQVDELKQYSSEVGIRRLALKTKKL